MKSIFQSRSEAVGDILAKAQAMRREAEDIIWRDQEMLDATKEEIKGLIANVTLECANLLKLEKEKVDAEFQQRMVSIENEIADEAQRLFQEASSMVDELYLSISEKYLQSAELPAAMSTGFPPGMSGTLSATMKEKGVGDSRKKGTVNKKQQEQPQQPQQLQQPQKIRKKRGRANV